MKGSVNPNGTIEEADPELRQMRERLRSFYQENDIQGLSVLVSAKGAVTFVQLEASWSAFRHAPEEGGYYLVDPPSKGVNEKAQVLSQTLIAISTLSKAVTHMATKIDGFRQGIVQAVGQVFSDNKGESRMSQLLEAAVADPHDINPPRTPWKEEPLRSVRPENIDPPLAQVMEEIEALLKKRDVAGIVSVATSKQSGAIRVLDPSWGGLESRQVSHPKEGAPTHILGVRAFESLGKTEEEADQRMQTTIQAIQNLLDHAQVDAAMLTQLLAKMTEPDHTDCSCHTWDHKSTQEH